LQEGAGFHPGDKKKGNGKEEKEGEKKGKLLRRTMLPFKLHHKTGEGMGKEKGNGPRGALTRKQNKGLRRSHPGKFPPWGMPKKKKGGVGKKSEMREHEEAGKNQKAMLNNHHKKKNFF